MKRKQQKKRTIELGGTKVPIEVDAGKVIDLDKALDSVPFKAWQESMAQNKAFSTKKITIQGVDMFGPRVGFIKFVADVEVDGCFVPGIVFMRGGSVGILVLLSCEGKEYALLTKQPRVPLGLDSFPEIPAGMLDGSGAFAGKAAEEMREETGIVIQEKDLVDMTTLAYGDKFKGVIPSSGGCDEFIRLFLFRKEVTPAELKDLMGKEGLGNRDEGEIITLDIVPLEDLWKVTADCKALSALCLYHNLSKAGKI